MEIVATMKHEAGGVHVIYVGACATGAQGRVGGWSAVDYLTLSLKVQYY